MVVNHISVYQWKFSAQKTSEKIPTYVRINPPSSHQMFVLIPPHTVIPPGILDLVKDYFAVNKNNSGKEATQRVADRFDIYLYQNKKTIISILDSVNQGCGLFGSSVYELIRTGTILAADCVSKSYHHDPTMSVYNLLLLGPNENNSKFLPPNGWTTIEQADVFVTAIQCFLEDIFREVVGGL